VQVSAADSDSIRFICLRRGSYVRVQLNHLGDYLREREVSLQLMPNSSVSAGGGGGGGGAGDATLSKQVAEEHGRLCETESDSEA
jgi:hypothetical protein